MAATALFVGTAKSPGATVSAANTNRDGTGTIVDIYTAGASGGRVDDLVVKATGTTTAGMIRLYKHDGTAYRLLREVSVSVITPSATVQSFESVLTDLAWVFAATHKLAASTHNAENFTVNVSRGGDF